MLKRILITVFVLSFVGGCQTKQSIGPVTFSRLTGDYWQIWTMNPDGHNAKQLTTSPSDKRYPAWSREDGKRLFFRDNNNRAFVIDMATREGKRILLQMGFIGNLAEAPNGNKLVVARFKSELMDSSDLWLTDMEGQNRRILTRDIGLTYDPAWSPNGKKIAYISGHGYQTHELCIINSDGTNKQKLTTNQSLELLPAFSPDGKSIAYVSDLTGNYEVWLMDADGSNVRQLTKSEGIDTRPCWSPDGTEILFVSSRGGNMQLWIMNSDGSNPRQLTSGAPCTDPAWRTGMRR
jgi:TolB protein